MEKTTLVLGWPTQLDARRKANANRLNPLMQKRSRDSADISYSIQYEGDGHLVSFAPTGSGKGVSAIIPNLLHYPGPTIVIDPKGENFAITARYRRSLGQKVLLLDPFEAVEPYILDANQVSRGRLNPLDLCTLSGGSITSDAQMIAELLSGDGSAKDNPFWDNSGRKLLSGLIAHEMESALQQKREPSFERIVGNLFADDPVYDMAKLMDTEKPTDFARKTIGGGFLGITNVTRDGILTTVQSYLATMMSKDITRYLESSTIHLSAIQNDADYTLYIVIPPTKLKSHSYLLKMWIGVLMHAVMERRRPPALRTLFMLDECASLGELDVLRKAVTLLRGYGLQVWMFFQDLSQLARLYKDDAPTMINNCGVVQAFGIRRQSGASALAAVIGRYKDTDLLNLDETQQVLSMPPRRVQVARLMRYYRDRVFAGRYDANPLIQKRRRPVRIPMSLRVRSRFA